MYTPPTGKSVLHSLWFAKLTHARCVAVEAMCNLHKVGLGCWLHLALYFNSCRVMLVKPKHAEHALLQNS